MSSEEQDPMNPWKTRRLPSTPEWSRPRSVVEQRQYLEGFQDTCGSLSSNVNGAVFDSFVCFCEDEGHYVGYRGRPQPTSCTQGDEVGRGTGSKTCTTVVPS